MPGYSPRFWLIFMAASLVLIMGWDTFLFTTDDAYIAFRYIEQRQMGHGYVWNAPPFLPVEGYSCLAGLYCWMCCPLSLGLPRPGAHLLSLIASIGSLLIVARWAQTGLQRRDEDGTGPHLMVVLALVVLSRLFLTWTSSGLETALFNFLLLLWLYKGMLGGAERHPNAGSGHWVGVGTEPGPPRRVSLCHGLSCADGGSGDAATARTSTWCGVCLACVAGVGPRPLAKEFLWGMAPNTYFAKVVGPLPDIGLRYLLSFGMEHGVFFLLLLVAVAAWRTDLGEREGARIVLDCWRGTCGAHPLLCGGRRWGPL